MKTKAPAPLSVSAPVPAMLPLTVKVVEAAAFNVEFAFTRTLRFAFKAVVAVMASVPPFKVTFVAAAPGAVPRALSAAIETVPLLI